MMNLLRCIHRVELDPHYGRRELRVEWRAAVNGAYLVGGREGNEILNLQGMGDEV